jgi:SulP family sulfate permease
MFPLVRPEILSSFGGYNSSRLGQDVLAGIVVGVVALPLCVAFAIASGVSPEKGIITGILAGAIVAILGGSRVQIAGPTGAFIALLYTIGQTYGPDGLATATMMAGTILVILGLARVGSVIKFIPHPVTVGFTSGIAVIIFTAQIPDLLGLSTGKVPGDFPGKVQLIWQHIGSINPYAAGLSVGSVLLIVVWQRISSRMPGAILALLAGTAAATLFQMPVETIGSRFGEIPAHFPAPAFPRMSFENLQNLISPAIAIALLAGIESLLTAVVADGMIGTRHRSNMELIAQGLANIISPIFGGIAATGAIARTAANIKNGGRTPVAGIVHSLTLLFIMLALGRYAKLIPLASLAGILAVVAYDMSQWRTFRSLLRSPRSDVIVLVTTFALTVVFDLTVAIEVGLILAVFLFIRRMAEVASVGAVTRELNDQDAAPDDPQAIGRKVVPEGVEVFEINGPFFFGAAYKFEESLENMEHPPKALIIRMRNVPAIDSTGIHILEEVYKTQKSRGITLILSGVHTQPLFALEKSGTFDMIGRDNIHANIDDALNRAREILNASPANKDAD